MHCFPFGRHFLLPLKVCATVKGSFFIFYFLDLGHRETILPWPKPAEKSLKIKSQELEHSYRFQGQTKLGAKNPRVAAEKVPAGLQPPEPSPCPRVEGSPYWLPASSPAGLLIKTKQILSQYLLQSSDSFTLCGWAFGQHLSGQTAPCLSPGVSN